METYRAFRYDNSIVFSLLSVGAVAQIILEGFFTARPNNTKREAGTKVLASQLSLDCRARRSG